MNLDAFDLSAGRVSRRSLLRGAVAGAAVAALPGLAAARSPGAGDDADRLEVELGYWQGGEALTSTAAVRAGFLSPCASATAACEIEVDEQLVAASGVDGRAGDYRIRVLGLGAAEALGPLKVEARYSAASHRLWQAWRDRGLLQTASPVSARWTSIAGEGLELRLTTGPAATRSLTVPARAGVYVATLSTDATVPNWRRVALRSLDAERPLTLSLVERRSGLASTTPHLLLTVERATA